MSVEAGWRALFPPAATSRLWDNSETFIAPGFRQFTPRRDDLFTTLINGYTIIVSVVFIFILVGT